MVYNTSNSDNNWHMPEVVLDDALLMTDTRWCSLDSPARRSPSAHKDRSNILSSFLDDVLRSVELQLDSPPVLLAEVLWLVKLSVDKIILWFERWNWCVDRQSSRTCRGTDSLDAVKDSFWVEFAHGKALPRISNFFLCKTNTFHDCQL